MSKGFRRFAARSWPLTNLDVMRNFITAFCAVLAFSFPSLGWTIDEIVAIRIAEDAAGCSLTKRCETRARIDENHWMLVVWFIRGYWDNGEPKFAPGGWVGFTIDQKGVIVEKMPGR